MATPLPMQLLRQLLRLPRRLPLWRPPRGGAAALPGGPSGHFREGRWAQQAAWPSLPVGPRAPGSGLCAPACASLPAVRPPGVPVAYAGMAAPRRRCGKSRQRPRPCEVSLELSEPSSERRACRRALYSTAEARQPTEGTMNPVFPLTCKWDRKGDGQPLEQELPQLYKRDQVVLNVLHLLPFC